MAGTAGGGEEDMLDVRSSVRRRRSRSGDGTTEVDLRAGRGASL